MNSTPYLSPLGLFFCVGFPIGKKNHKMWRGISIEYSYQVWYQWAQWFQRMGVKCKSLWTITYTRWWQYFTWPICVRWANITLQNTDNRILECCSIDKKTTCSQFPLNFTRNETFFPTLKGNNSCKT